MSVRSQIICAWCGMLCPVFMVLGLWPAAQFFPPTHPTASAGDIAVLYQQHASGIRLGTICFLIAGALFAAFVAVIVVQMRRMEHAHAPVLSYTQLASGAAVILFFVIPAMMWSVAAFRPERNPEITQALNDIGWFVFVMPATLPILQNIVLGCAILGDRKPVPVMPRWVGFFNLWLALLWIPGVMITYFKTGPFAWNGLLAFWIPAITFGLWFNVVAFYVMKAARAQAAEAHRQGETP